MSTRSGSRGHILRSYRRRKEVLDLDLNSTPPGENREQGGPSTLPEQLPAQTTQTAQTAETVQQSRVVQPIDVEAIDDDVVISTPTAFNQARNNARRNRGMTTIVDVDLVAEDLARVPENLRRRDSSNQTIITCDLLVNLEGSSSSASVNVTKPPEPPAEPVFNCPICMGPLVEEMSTKCGHIFCKSCIKAAISAQGKCPTCRKKVTVKELIRVFLPTTN